LLARQCFRLTNLSPTRLRAPVAPADDVYIAERAQDLTPLPNPEYLLAMNSTQHFVGQIIIIAIPVMAG
jgi:hypothetical protein